MFKKLFFHCVVAFILSGLAGCLPGPDKPLPGSLIGPPSLSRDGELIAFTYGKTVGDNHLLLYDVKSEQLRLIDKPAHLVVKQPSFSPDGRWLAIATYCAEACVSEEQNYQIAIVDIESGELNFLTSGRDFARNNPIFSANGQTIFFRNQELSWREDWLAAGKNWPFDEKIVLPGFSGLSELNIETGEVNRIFPSSTTPTEFTVLSLGRATLKGAVWFSGIGPQSGDVAVSVKQMEREYASLGYVFHSEYGLRLLPENRQWSMASLSTSEDGARGVFISSPEGSPYDYELYQTIEGRVRSVTSLKTHMAFANVSANGRKAVFLADETRQKNWSIWIHDFENDETRVILTAEQIVRALEPEPASTGSK